ncbi:electron transport complex subunit RsxG [Celerinatantimonas yamalensis]|uniref:Ion-translocating oxidoreductase complex subunit G n=1 Tax=Celerinatantimonas yamalensis TaxID=559956 RepID=A0ABW9G3K1_9GAMM
MNNPVVKNAVLLALFALICTLFVVFTNQLTGPKILQQQQAKLSRSLKQVLPADLVNPALLKSCRLIHYPEYLGNNELHKVWIARKNGQVQGIAYQTTAPDGYNGNIQLLVGVLRNGIVSGVRVISENETPGLGDKIELRKTNWILDFTGKRLRSSNDSRWAVKKDGGMFDQFSGATITPRAVVKAIKHTLELNQLKADEIISSHQKCGD